jgi:imidazolonepropionase-like amidohydrolase
VPKTHTGGNVLIKNATILPVSGPMIEKASVLVRSGKIAAIAPDLAVPEGTLVIDAKGLFLVPGAIDCHSHLAISGGVNEMSDSITADCKIGDVINPDDIGIYRALAGGCVAARLLHGSANAIGGEHAVIKLKWKRNAADLLVSDAPRGIKFALGENPKQSNFRAPDRPIRYPNSRMGVEAVIRRAFDEAKDWLAQKKDDLDKVGRNEFVPPRRRDVRLETIAAILSGDVAIHSHCYRADEILMLLDTAEQYGVKVKTLQHVLEGYKVAPEIARHGAGASTFSDWWAYKIEAYDAIPYNAALMTRAGVLVTINSDSDELVRRLHLDSGKSMRYGMLTPEECLAMCTLNTAKQLGLEKKMGSIEVGKDADLALFDAHPLSVEAKCMLTLVDGEVEFERKDQWVDYIADLPKPKEKTGRAPYAATTPWAADPKIPAPPREKLAIVHATLVPVGAPAVSDGTLVIENGIITAMGPALAPPAGARVIDATGLFVYPGLIDGGVQLGLTEIDSVVGTVDTSEVDPNQPDLHAVRALNAATTHIPVARGNGTTTAVVAPRGGFMRGQSAVVHLDGWTGPEMCVVDPLALAIDFPAQRADDPEKTAEENAKEREKAYKSSTKELKDSIERAIAYSKRPKGGARDPKLEALAPYALGTRPIVFSVGSARDAVGAVRFAEEHNLKCVLAAGTQEIGRVAGLLAEKEVPVLLGFVTTLPGRREDPYDTCYSAPRILHAAGVKFGFASGDSANARNLPFQAGMAIAYGLPADAALRAVTLSTAEILGIDEKLGSLAVGKSADVIVTDGSPLEVRTHVKHEIIGGREVDLSSKHTQLYEKYLGRLTPEQKAKAGAPR